MTATTEDDETKAGRNQALFREVNERVKAIDEEHAIPTDVPWEFLCECADTDCTKRISLTPAEYEAVRRVPTHFSVATGHEWPDVERVVEHRGRFVVVEKVGKSGVIAVELDPRGQAAGA